MRSAANTQVRLPYHTTALPTSLPIRFVQVHQSIDGAHWVATVQYGQDRTTYGD
jgi:hypothetical protein